MIRLSLYHLCVCVCVQVRHYSPTRWVSTDAEAYFMGVGAAMAFRRLFQYITGANEGGDALTKTFWAKKKISNRTVFLIAYVRVCRHSDGDDGPCSCQDPRGDQNVGACCLHTQLPTASSLSGQAAGAHE